MVVSSTRSGTASMVISLLSRVSRSRALCPDHHHARLPQAALSLGAELRHEFLAVIAGVREVHVLTVTRQRRQYGHRAVRWHERCMTDGSAVDENLTGFPGTAVVSQQGLAELREVGC